MRHPGPFARYAAHILKGGYSPIPVQWESKRPFVRGWPELCREPMTREKIAQLAANYPALGVAVAGGYNGLAPIDFDTDDPEILAAIAKVLPRPSVAKAGRRGFVGFYRCEPPGSIGARKFRTAGSAGKMIAEILVTGKTVIPPSIHPETRKPYRWLTGKRTLYSVPVSDLVLIAPKHIDALAKALAPWCPIPKPWKPKPVTGRIVADEAMQRYASAALRLEARQLAGMPRDSGRSLQLFRAGLKMGKYVHHRVLGVREVENALLRACEANGLLREAGEKECRRVIVCGFRYTTADELPAIMGDRR